MKYGIYTKENSISRNMMGAFVAFLVTYLYIFGILNFKVFALEVSDDDRDKINATLQNSVIDDEVYVGDDVVIPEVVEEVIEEKTYFDVPLSEDLQDHIFNLCEEKGIDPAIIISMIYRESRFKENVIGDSGNSYGLMQIQPKWHKARMERLGCTDLLDPYQNVAVGIDLLGELLSSGKGIEWALMAYNGGSGYANKKAANGEISEYAAYILDHSSKLTEFCNIA